MNRIYRGLLAFGLALALLAGPVGAVCVDCCPRADAPLTLAVAAACCGDCAPTIDRAPDPASPSVKAASFGLETAFALIVSSARPHVAVSFRPPVTGTPSAGVFARALPAPLRL